MYLNIVCREYNFGFCSSYGFLRKMLMLRNFKDLSLFTLSLIQYCCCYVFGWFSLLCNLFIYLYTFIYIYIYIYKWIC